MYSLLLFWRLCDDESEAGVNRFALISFEAFKDDCVAQRIQ